MLWFYILAAVWIVTGIISGSIVYGFSSFDPLGPNWKAGVLAGLSGPIFLVIFLVVGIRERFRR